MIVGVVSGSWGTAGAADVKSIVNYVRLDRGSTPQAFAWHQDAGLKVCALFAGPYTTGGVQAMNRAAWVSSTLAWYKANTDPSKAPIVEALNEPGGSWFWGSNANSASNAAAYGALVHDLAIAFLNEYGDKCPVILASVDGGSAGGNVGWGNNVWKAIPNVATLPIYGTIHPYQGASGSNGPDANRNSITTAHGFTGKPIYVTELGWPTCGGTSDSPNTSEAAQASKITSFYNWAKSTGYVAAFFYYNYRDESAGRCYGIEGHDGRAKPGKAALHAASVDSPTPTPTPVPTPTPTGQVTIKLAPDPSQVVFEYPSTITQLKVYESDGAAYPAPAGTYDYQVIPAITTPWKPKRAYVDAVGLDASGNQVGTWFSDTPGGSRVHVLAPTPPPVPVPDADLKALYGLVEELRKAGGYRVQNPPQDSAAAAKTAYINLGKAMQNLATKYGLPFV